MLIDIDYIEEILRVDEAIVYPDFRNALVGFTISGDTRAIYDYNKCVTILVGQGSSEDDAIEHLDYNCVDAYLGEKTPIFIYTKEMIPEKGIGVSYGERKKDCTSDDGE